MIQSVLMKLKTRLSCTNNLRRQTEKKQNFINKNPVGDRNVACSVLLQCPQSGWPRGGWLEKTLVLGTQDQRLHSSREKGPSCLLPYCSHLRNLPGRNLWWNPPEEKKNYNIMPGQERHPSRSKGETRNTWKKERQQSRRSVAARPATRAVQEPQGRIK